MGIGKGMNQILFQYIISTSTRPICVAVKKMKLYLCKFTISKKMVQKSRTQNHWQPGSKDAACFLKINPFVISIFFMLFHLILHCKKVGGQCPPGPPGFDATAPIGKSLLIWIPKIQQSVSHHEALCHSHFSLKIPLHHLFYLI